MTELAQIDAVYTWVNCNDPKWEQEFQAYLQSALIKPQKASIDRCRFRDYGELYYSVLSLHKFAPWIQRIFIIKKSYQFPDLKDLPSAISDKIIWINELDIKPFEIEIVRFYPTFNSLALEANLHRIPGLSEQFIYFNNDMFLGKPVEPDFFFPEKKIRFSLSKTCFSKQMLRICFGNSWLRLIRGHWLHTRNSLQLFNQTFPSVKGLDNFSAPLHQCTPLLKSAFELGWSNATIKEQLIRNSCARFRSDEQVHPAFLMSLISLWQGKANLFKEQDCFIQLHKGDFKKKLTRLMQDKAYRFCLNDHQGNYSETFESISSFLEEYFM